MCDLRTNKNHLLDRPEMCSLLHKFRILLSNDIRFTMPVS